MSPHPEPTYRLYCQKAWGSTIVEAALVLTKATFCLIEVDGFDQPGEAREALLAVNPMAQVPTLILPDETVMTESAAIALHLSEAFPEANLAPPPGSSNRALFLRRLIWLVASVYSKSTYDDYPERFAPSAPLELRSAVRHQREELWRQWEAEIEPAPWALGKTFSILDVYIAVMTRWIPRRDWFTANTPKIASIAHAADALPTLQDVWNRNYPTQ